MHAQREVIPTLRRQRHIRSVGDQIIPHARAVAPRHRDVDRADVPQRSDEPPRQRDAAAGAQVAPAGRRRCAGGVCERGVVLLVGFGGLRRAERVEMPERVPAHEKGGEDARLVGEDVVDGEEVFVGMLLCWWGLAHDGMESGWREMRFVWVWVWVGVGVGLGLADTLEADWLSAGAGNAGEGQETEVE